MTGMSDDYEAARLFNRAFDNVEAKYVRVNYGGARVEVDGITYYRCRLGCWMDELGGHASDETAENLNEWLHAAERYQDKMLSERYNPEIEAELQAVRQERVRDLYPCPETVGDEHPSRFSLGLIIAALLIPTAAFIVGLAYLVWRAG